MPFLSVCTQKLKIYATRVIDFHHNNRAVSGFVNRTAPAHANHLEASAINSRIRKLLATLVLKRTEPVVIICNCAQGFRTPRFDASCAVCNGSFTYEHSKIMPSKA